MKAYWQILRVDSKGKHIVFGCNREEIVNAKAERLRRLYPTTTYVVEKHYIYNH